MFIDKKNVKLLSPAGNFSCLIAAINGGADAIYFGIEHLNMRSRSSKNFKIEDIKYISNICKSNNILSCLAINTILYDHDLSFAKKIIDKAKEFKIDSLILMDQSVIQYAKNIGIKIHLSTQLNINNIEMVKFYSKFSDIIVLSRELSLTQIKRIIYKINKFNIRGPSGNLLKIEIFCHGAFCMAISGKCYLSLHSYNSSANRGACKQNCRRKYILIDMETGFEIKVDNKYLMSSKDLCTINFLDEIINSGINILKIEGRGRSTDYVYTTTKCYKEAIKSIYDNTFNKEKINYWMNKLKEVYNRGFWSGYYLGQNIGEWVNSSGSISTNKKIYIGKIVNFYKKVKIGEFLIESYNIKEYDKIIIIGNKTGIKKLIIKNPFVNGKKKKIVKKGEKFTITLNFRVRLSDKFYKLINR